MSSDEIVRTVVCKSNRIKAKKARIQVRGQTDLRIAREVLQRAAARHRGWTLFVNRRGSLCRAFHHSGCFLTLESPSHLVDLRHEEHAVNYFLNRFREVAVGVV